MLTRTLSHVMTFLSIATLVFTYCTFLRVGMPVKSSEVPERVPATGETYHQRWRALGKSCTGGNPQGSGATTRRRCAQLCLHVDGRLFTANLQTAFECWLTFCSVITVCCTVDRYLSSEVSVFFELRVRYLLACERTCEAMALALKCSQHPTAGRRLFFKQAYLACLWKSSQQERLFMEVCSCSLSIVK